MTMRHLKNAFNNNKKAEITSNEGKNHGETNARRRKMKIIKMNPPILIKYEWISKTYNQRIRYRSWKLKIRWQKDHWKSLKIKQKYKLQDRKRKEEIKLEGQFSRYDSILIRVLERDYREKQRRGNHQSSNTRSFSGTGGRKIVD